MNQPRRAIPTRRMKFEEFSGLDQAHWQHKALNPYLKPLWLRVMFAAGGWSNLIGHAEFTPSTGGLSLLEILSTPDKVTGRPTPVSRSHANNAIAQAVQRGLVGEGSTPECLIAPPWLDKPGGVRLTTRTCHTHGIRPKRVRADRAPVTKSVTQITANVTESVTERHRFNDGAAS